MSRVTVIGAVVFGAAVWLDRDRRNAFVAAIGAAITAVLNAVIFVKGGVRGRVPER